MTTTASTPSLVVRPVIHERYTYECVSDRPPFNTYRVIVTANGGYSVCNCTDWGTRRQPNIRKNEPMGTRATMCRHVEAVRTYFLNEILTELSRQEGTEH